MPMLTQILGYWMIGLMIGAFAAVSLALGLRGVIHRTPFMIASRKLYQLSIGCYLPGLAYFLLMLFPLKHAPILRAPGQAVPLALSVLLLVFVFWVHSREPAGYLFIGARPGVFREVLTAVLREMGLAYQEDGSILRLTDNELDLRVSASAWMGLAQLQAGQKDGRALLGEIARCIEEQLEAQGARSTLLPSAVYVLIGVALMTMTTLYVAATGAVALGLK